MNQGFFMNIFARSKAYQAGHKDPKELAMYEKNRSHESLLPNSDYILSQNPFDDETENLIASVNSNAFIFESFNFKFTPYMRALKPGFERSSHMHKQAEFKTKSFFSTPNFINDLTEISMNILHSQDKMKFLHNSLKKINQNLPALCYLPVMNKNQRNYMVLKIAEMESRLFITAEKAPFLICIEVF